MSTKWNTLFEEDKSGDIEIEFDDDQKAKIIKNETNDDEDNNDDSDDVKDKKKPVVDEDDNVEDNDDDDSDEEKKPVKSDRRKSRAAKRIRSLVNQNKNLQVEFERKLREETEKIRSEIATNNTSNEIESKLNNATSEFTQAKNKLAKALEDGDNVAVAEAQAAMSGLAVDIRVLKAQKEKKPTVEVEKKQETKQELQIPEAYEDCVEDKDWFVEPESRAERRLKRYAIKISKDLEEDGLSPEDDEFYEELDTELKKFVEENELDIDGYKTKKSKSKKTPVQEDSREKFIRRGPNGKTRVRLTKEEKEMADRMNVSYENYARQKLAQEKGGRGYTTID